MKKRELTGAKQGQIKVTCWRVWTLTSAADLLGGGRGVSCRGLGEQRPIHPLSFIWVRAAGVTRDLQAVRTSQGVACDRVKRSLKSCIAPLWGMGEGRVLGNPREFIFGDILLNQVGDVPRSPEKTARLLLCFLLSGF